MFDYLFKADFLKLILKKWESMLGRACLALHYAPQRYFETITLKGVYWRWKENLLIIMVQLDILKLLVL